VAFIGDENASRAPANLEWMEQRMPERRRFTPTTLKIAVSKEANAVAQAGARCPRWTLSAASWFAKPAEPRQLPIR